MIKEFTLGAIKWTVKQANQKLDELKFMGLCEFPKSTISVFTDGIDKDLIDQTVYHEVVHAILESMGENALSENDKFVQNFALLLHQFEMTKIEMMNNQKCDHPDFYTINNKVYCNECSQYLGYFSPGQKPFGFHKEVKDIITNEYLNIENP